MGSNSDSVPSGAGSSTSTPTSSAHANGTTQRARFRVKFSDVVLAYPKGAQQHPSYLSFSFDSFWQAETGPTSPPPSEAETHHPLAFQSYSNNSNKCKLLDRPEPELRFIYETSLASKLHRKKLVLTLNLPPDASIPQATAIISIDALARGCQRIALTFPNPLVPNGLPIATAHFRVSVLHFERVQAVLSDVKVEDYPEKHIHDVKLLYIEMGYTPFADGPVNPTEKCSDAEPVFKKLPTLEKVCSLQEMLHGGVARTDLRVCFALHRQVARALTEEIGVGALPIHLLFPKIGNGKMDEPARVKVPLGGFKGVVRAKIMLLNIPQWSQLGGDDLVNRDGVITPSSVDLNTRKLLPWMKLPRTSANGRRLNIPSPAVRPYSSPPNVPLMSSGPSSITASDQLHLPPHQLSHLGPGMHVSAPSAKWPEAAPFLLPPHIAPAGQRIPYPDYASGMTIPLPPSRGVPGFVDGASSSFTDQDAKERERLLQHEYQRQREECQRNAYFATNNLSVVPPPSANYLIGIDASTAGPGSSSGADSVGVSRPVTPGHPDSPDASSSLNPNGRSSKSVGSSTTGYDANSPPQSQASDDGLQHQNGLQHQDGSQHQERLQHQEGLQHQEVSQHLDGLQHQEGLQYQQEVDEWVAVLDGASNRYYFANSSTNESLWLPPMWEQLLDGDGRPFFVDHGSQSTQREFPAEESRKYKESVSNGTYYN